MLGQQVFPPVAPFDAAAKQALLEATPIEARAAYLALKDAVKLGPRWPRQASGVWYLSQAVEVERGGALLREALQQLVLGSQR